LLTLRSDTGTVLRVDEQSGYVDVWLDEPADYQQVGPSVQLQEIREAIANLEVLDEAGD
jgi:hypothetical protein